MATVTAKAKRRAEAEARLTDVTASLADRLTIEIPAQGRPVRDVELAAIIELERQADVLEAILAAQADPVDKSKPKSTTKAKGA